MCLMSVHAWIFETCTVKEVLLHTYYVFKSPPNYLLKSMDADPATQAKMNAYPFKELNIVIKKAKPDA